jgi:flagellar motor switch protein FliN
MSTSDDLPADLSPEAEAAATPAATASPLAGAFPELEAPDAGSAAAVAGAAPKSAQSGRSIEALLNVDLRVQVILGHARMPISQLLKLTRGAVIELDRRIGEPVDVVINDRLVARGDLVKLDNDRIGVTLTEIVHDYVADS